LERFLPSIARAAAVHGDAAAVDFVRLHPAAADLVPLWLDVNAGALRRSLEQAHSAALRPSPLEVEAEEAATLVRAVAVEAQRLLLAASATASLAPVATRASDRGDIGQQSMVRVARPAADGLASPLPPLPPPPPPLLDSDIFG